MTRKCRGAEYRIHVKNSGKGGAPKLVVDGKPVKGDLVPYAKPGSTVIVESSAERDLSWAARRSLRGSCRLQGKFPLRPFSSGAV